MAWKFGMGFLGGYILVQGFFGVLIFAPFRLVCYTAVFSGEERCVTTLKTAV